MAHHTDEKTTDWNANGGVDRRTSHMTDHLDYYDLNFGAIYQFIIAIGVTFALSYLAIWGIMEFMDAEYGPKMAEASPVSDKLFVEPPIYMQTAPNLDLVNYREEQDSVLVTDKDGGLAIDDAMKSVVANGLPYRKDSEGSNEVGTTNSADPIGLSDPSDAAAASEAEGHQEETEL